jgi:hypothetical protein
MKFPCALSVLFVLLGVSSVAGQTITEFSVPTPGASPFRITASPDGNLSPNGVDLRIKPLCSANRRLNALLPSAAIALLTGPMNPCQDSGELNTIQLKIPDLQDAPTGVVGKPSLSPDYPKAESVYFYFLVDSNHDGTFGGGDDGYNLVWQSGIYLTRTEYSDRTVYELTTDLTSPNAELIQGIGSGGTSKGVFCVPLRLTATRLK